MGLLTALRGEGHAYSAQALPGPEGHQKRALTQSMVSRRDLLLPAGPVLSPACCASWLSLPRPA